ncbi:MAG: AAA family ATPase [Cyanobacteria bacterium SBLK]|nr:AAA family ATPase [Cyanobacteria bacterium SBLK]
MSGQRQAIASKQLYESGRTFVYRSDRPINGQPVILKTLKPIYTDAENLAWFRREYEIIRRLDGVGAIEAYDFWEDRDRPTIVLEDFGGESLAQLELAGHLNLEEFLELAIAIVDCLARVHEAGIIHKDINPSNIVLNPKTKQVKIIDFGISTARSREVTVFSNANALEGTLAYISPEQTGRMNRAIDDRCDLYSLGVTFYELLAGKLPFQQEDPVELIHAHIAKIPPILQSPVTNHQSPVTSDATPANRIRQGNAHQESYPLLIPTTIVEIVMKLMAKNAEDRYQSAYGLKVDLETCWQQWQRERQIEPFGLGDADRGDRLQIPQKLYGRDEAIMSLLQTFTEGIHRQQPVLCLVKGYSGIGKSTLIAEVYKPVTVRHGFFVSGKFDPLQRDTPYSAIARAFSALVRQLLAESEAELQQWRERLQTALGNNGDTIVEVVPELELIIGQQPKLPELGATESQNRFNLTVQNFLRVFTKRDRPLVLFLDDLQWADSASLQLLQLLMTAPETGYFFAIGAYRDNEVDAAHPLMLALKNIRQGGIEIAEITLNSLPLEEIEKLVGDTLFCSPQQGQPLTQLLQEKTGGNPFFLNEFIKALYSEQLLYFNPREREWQWDIERIRRQEITANVVELLAGKIQKLPLSVRKILQLAACIGNRFDLSTLSEIAAQSPSDTAIALQVAIDRGFLLPLNKSYKLIEAKIKTNVTLPFKFAHDRIQQAAYSLMPDWEKRRIHLLLGRQLLAKTSLEERDENIFSIVNQLNLARRYIVKHREKNELARLNLEAGKKAKASAAWRSAIAYLKTGMELLPPRCWQEPYDLTLELHIEAVEAAYLCGEFETMAQWTELVLKHARTVLDKVRVCETRILSYAAKSQPKRALDTALDILALLGVKFPQKPRKLHLLLALGKLNLALANKQPEYLIHLPPMKNPIKLAALRILAGVLPAAYFTSPEFFGLIILKQVSLSLQYGNAPLSAYGYCNYGLMLAGVLGFVKTGYRFGITGKKLLMQLNAWELKAKIFMIFNTFIIHWQEHLNQNFNPLLEGYQSGLETGDIEFATYCLGIYNNSLFFTGKNLDRAQRDINNYAKKIEQLQQKQALYRVRHLQNIIAKLLGQAEVSPGIEGNPYNEEELINLQRKESDRGALGYLYILKLQFYYWLASYTDAEINRLKAEEYLDSIRGGYVSSLFYFYGSLSCLSIYADTPQDRQKSLLNRVRNYQKKIKKWACHAPMNFLHKYHLIEAERYRILEQYELASDFYDRAIQGAKENHYIQEEAIANERAGQFYLAREKEAIARTYLQQAYICYARWGAKVKTQKLLQTYPQCFSAPVREAFLSHIRTTIASTRTDRSTDTIDFASILKASRAIGSEIVLDKLLARMMGIIIENAAAQRGILLLNRKGIWQMEAEIAIEPERVEVLQSQPFNELAPFCLPKSILVYVMRSRKSIVLDRAAEEGDFTRDEYFNSSHPLSLLCTPLLHQGKLIGLLYLEHRASVGIFSRDRLEVLQLLTAQAAIALENALLYANLSRTNATLEEKVQRRTKEINAKNRDLERTLAELKQTQSQLIHAEKMSGIGQMVAGVAHEINNPISFIYSNLDPARNYIEDILYLLEQYRKEHSRPSSKLQIVEEDIDIDFIEEDLPKLLDSMQNGAQRIETIVKGLRVFSHLDEAEYKTINLHENIDSTLMLLQHRLRKTKEFAAIQVIKEYKVVPPITCYASQLNQAFFSIITNAIDALRDGDRNAAKPPEIRIRTETRGENCVRIAIADNGMGMDEATCKKVFEPFFTTKPVGSGTGLGLSTTYQIIVEHHQGAIACRSKLAEGTEFIIDIPACR